MRKQVRRYFFSVALSVMLAVVSAAGANPSINLRATIPFDFSVNGKTLPAGTYTIATKSPGLFVIRSMEGSEGMFFLTESTQTENQSDQLVFLKYGDHYFLTEVCAGDGEFRVPESRKEQKMIRELQSQLAKKASAPVLIHIPAN